MFDIADPTLVTLAFQLQHAINPSGVVIYRARAGGVAPTLEVLANTNHPVDRKLDTFLEPRVTIGHLVIEMNHELIIDDTLTHPLVKGSGAIKVMGIMAYIGVPYRLSGQAIGGVSVVHQHRRNWTEAEIEAVRAVARQLDRVAAEYHARGARDGTTSDGNVDRPIV